MDESDGLMTPHDYLITTYQSQSLILHHDQLTVRKT